MINSIKFLLLKRKVDSLERQISQNTRRRIEVKGRGRRLTKEYEKSREALKTYLQENPDIK